MYINIYSKQTKYTINQCNQNIICMKVQQQQIILKIYLYNEQTTVSYLDKLMKVNLLFFNNLLQIIKLKKYQNLDSYQNEKNSTYQEKKISQIESSNDFVQLNIIIHTLNLQMSSMHNETQIDHVNIILFSQKHLQPKKQNIWDTNFGIQVKNDFIFLLLHLRNQNNKNPININIPQLAVFVQGLLYDMIYYQNGHIRSRRFIDQKKIRRVQIISFFTKVLKENLSEHYIVKLRQNQYLMLSEIDLTQLCYKNRFDPIWIKIQYIQNKVEVENYNYIKQLYDCDIQYPSELIKLATESLLGYINQKEIREQLSEQLYLVYVNLKIALFLNYKHNIRIKKCLFFYLKTKSQNQDYILINAENLQFTNLTEPLKKRNQRLQKQLQQRNKIIQMTPEKQQKIKKYINPQNISNIQQIQNQMNRHYEETINKLGMRSIGSQRNNDQKNDMAFTKLFPQCNKKLKEFISSDKFYQLKDELLGVKKRKGLIRSSNNRFYTFSKIKLSEEKKIKKNLTTFINKRYKTNHCGFFLTQNRLLDSSKGQLLDKTQISMNSII